MKLDIDYMLKILSRCHDQDKAPIELGGLMMGLEVSEGIKVKGGKNLEKFYHHMMCIKEAGFLVCIQEGWYKIDPDANPKEKGIDFGFDILNKGEQINFLGNTLYRLTLSGQLFLELLSDPDLQMIGGDGSCIKPLESVDLDGLKIHRPAVLIALIKGMIG